MSDDENVDKDNDPLQYFISRMDEAPAEAEGGEGEGGEDLSFAAYKEKKIKEMLDEGWVLPGQAIKGGPPARAAPLPPRKTTAPSGVFIQKLDYDTSHMWNTDLNDEEDSNDAVPIPWEGTTVASKYEVGEEIGSGATSIVFAAKAKEGGADVAIKVISELTSEFVSPNQFKGTSNRISKSQGDGVVKFIEAFEENDTHFIVLERLQNTLFRKIWKAESAITEEVASGIISQILKAVDTVHKADFSHNDVTAGNLVVGATLQSVKLTGFAKATQGSSKGDLALSSILKAPELLGEAKQHDSKVDIWSVGLLTHLILSGTYPFKDAAEVLKGELNFDGEVWADVSDSAKDFIKKLLTPSPEDRPDSSAALSDEWIKVSHVSISPFCSYLTPEPFR
eukprot:TRINITY_DN1861_c0_g1_i2.p1 TRINITY_DN1861_c0_g1~~TRINITY_DN1861_c0_g1_i2.p1  ORF type:complete len:394 (+),score=110.41 TRINITY_DN1861_c0_g1_i2:348-1529(+)